MDSTKKSTPEIREKQTSPRPTSDTLKKPRGVSSKFLTAREQHTPHTSSKNNDPLRVLSQIRKGSTKGTDRFKRQAAQDRLNKLRDHLQQELIERNHSRVSVDAITKPKTTVSDHATATEASSLPRSSAAPCVEDIDMVDIDALLTPNPLPPGPLPMECDALTDPAPAECCTAKRNPDKEDQESRTEKSTKVATNYLENAASFEKHMFLVLDSCVYMNEIVSIMDIFRNEVPISKPQPILVVPYKVLQELELVKVKKKDLSPAITKVTKFLHSMLKMRDKRIKGQRPIDTHLELFEMCSPDDAILNCALQVKQVVGEDKVVLVSEDRSLLTKALVAELKAYSWKEFCDRYDFDT